MPDLTAVRRFYAEELEAVASLRSRALVDAFAEVPRERFLGAGPWQIATGNPSVPGAVRYRETPDADPRRVYHNTLVALDAARQINNGHPGTLATCLDALDLRAGDTLLHVGCGVGYYTAIAAEVVGAAGRVIGLEIDPALAARAAENLRPWRQVELREADGTSHVPPPCDAIFVNAGVTHPLPLWLHALNPGGRLVLPITFATPGTAAGTGWMLRITREAGGWPALPVSPIAIFTSPTGRDDRLNDAIKKALVTGRWAAGASLRFDPHEPEEACLVHAGGVCLTTARRP
jgi:protein-L-isoaspartate(D-aspartate) O-methyltransferase